MRYKGSKQNHGMWQWIVNQMPPHQCYVEAFLGSGAVLKHKRPALVNIGIDADLRVLERFPARDDVRLVCDDAISYLRKERWQLGTLIYCDPPYLLETRRYKGRLYRHEMSNADHMRLLDVLRSLDCMVILSGYASELYARRLADWRTLERRVPVRGGRWAQEVLWLNYPEPVALHDGRFVGDGYRARENFSRKVKRWRARLERMTSIERNALLEALGPVQGSAVPAATGVSDDGGRGEVVPDLL